MPAYRAHIETLETAFENLIKQVPGITDFEIYTSSARNALTAYGVDIDKPDMTYAFEAKLTTPSRENWRAIVQTRASGEPRLVRESCARLHAIIQSHPERERLYPVVAATYISNRSREICKEMNVGFIDLSGNCRLAFDSIFIEREVAENKHVEKRPLRTLFSPKSSRAIRLMLENPARAWLVQDLAHESLISLGLASKVKQKLLELEFATATGDGLKLKDPEAVLVEWSENYSYKQNELMSCYAPGGQYETEGHLANYCDESRTPYALTLFSAANRVAPFIRGLTLSAAYVDANLNQVATKLGWKPVPSGANFILLRPQDEFILRKTRTSPTEWPGVVVSDIQLYLDLASHKARGTEAAEFLLEQKIRPAWAAARSESK